VKIFFPRNILILLILSLFLPIKAQDIIINELLASNGSLHLDPQNFNFVDWIEIHNTGSELKDIGGYFLSDDFSSPEKWRIPLGTTIPAKGFLVFWADGTGAGLHPSFQLTSDGEEVLIADENGRIIDSVSYGIQLTDISYGRIPDSSSVWAYYHIPTPFQPNITERVNNLRLKASPPSLSPPGGFFDGPMPVSITEAGSETSIYYTVTPYPVTPFVPIVYIPITSS